MSVDGRPSLGLLVGNAIPASVAARMTYAAKTYAAVYGIDWKGSSGEVRLCYGVEPSRPGDVPLEVAYRSATIRSEMTQPVSQPGLFLDHESDAFPRIHPCPVGVDWLAEIFEWLGGEVEHHSEERNSIGTVPFAHTVPGRYGLDPEIPWAAIAMRGLHLQIRSSVPNWPERPLGGTPVIAATHDIDFLPLSPTDSLRRAAKNVAVALVSHRSLHLAASIVQNLSAFDTFDEVVNRERSMGIQSSAYVIVKRSHRRDANYLLSDARFRRFLQRLDNAGMEIGVHGSYNSVLGGGSLRDEYELLRGAGFTPSGGRQHWLRYRAGQLFKELMNAGASYDCSVGFNDLLGFRAGASFAYAPYDFAAESPVPLLELPVVVMDAAVFAVDRFDASAARARVERVLRRSILYSLGGVSIIWHNTGFGGVQIPRFVGDLYWELKRDAVRWTSGHAVMREMWPRFQRAGLLPHLR